jgi:hypothetical protein
MVEMVCEADETSHYDDSFGYAVKSYCKNMIPIVKDIFTLFPDAFGKYIDWYKVEALGSVHKYPTYKSLQTKKYGKPTKKYGNEPEVIGKFYVDTETALDIVKLKTRAKKPQPEFA